MLDIKILGLKHSNRFLIRRVVTAALDELRPEHPDLGATVTNVKDLDGILKYTPVLMTGALVVNEKLVCVGRYPKKDKLSVGCERRLGSPPDGRVFHCPERGVNDCETGVHTNKRLSR